MGPEFTLMQLLLLLFMIIAFPLSLFSSLLAILLALLRHKKAAKNAAIFGIGLAICVSLILAIELDPYYLGLAGSFFFVISVLGIITLILNRVYAELEPVKGFQIPLSVIFFLIAILGCGLGIYKYSQKSYYRERDELLIKYQTISGINDIRITGHENSDVFWIGEVTFSVEGIPNSIVKISYEPPTTTPSFRDSELIVKQIGPWEFQQDMTYIYKPPSDFSGTSSSYSRNYISLGKKGHANQYPDKIDVEIHTIEDIRDNYRELVGRFKKWPTKSNPGTFIIVGNEKDTQYDYYCLYDPTYDLIEADQPKATVKQPPSD
ncbi:MAG: hypothetical protein COA78_23655 [Blastopirellula sp.]|nr:MAG: hypothetical protein COA78_23655 [Blastopirellula sp.]